jgi:hypothetical protein
MAFLGRGRPDDVIDRRRIDAIAITQRRQDNCAEVLRVKVGKRSLAGFAYPARRPHSVDDECLWHGTFRNLTSKIIL